MEPLTLKITIIATDDILIFSFLSFGEDTVDFSCDSLETSSLILSEKKCL